MKTTLSSSSNGLSASTLALALAVTLLPGLVRPQAAAAQLRGRRGFGGGASFGGFHPGLPSYSPPTLPRQGGGRPQTGGRGAVPPGPPTKTGGGGPSGGPYQPPVAPGPGNRSVTLPSFNPYPYAYNGPTYPVTGLVWGAYFPYGYAYSNYYATANGYGAMPSVYSSFSGNYPPFITNGYLLNVPPALAYVRSVLDEQYQGAPGNQGSDQMTVSKAAANDPLLGQAISDIATTWTQKDIAPLSKHITDAAPVSIYLKGKYVYSMKGDDYLNMTRDALTSVNSVNFILDKVQQDDDFIYTVSGHHTYVDRNNEGKTHTVLVSYVLEKVSNQYFISQVEMVPGKQSIASANGGQKGQLIDPATQHATSRTNAHAFPYDSNPPKAQMTGPEWNDIFPSHLAYYPSYYPSFQKGTSTSSPYAYYGGVVPRFIANADARRDVQQTAYVPVPLYSPDGTFKGYSPTNDGDQNGNMTVTAATAQNPMLAGAISDIETAWMKQDDRSMSRHIHRDTPANIYMKDQYMYSLEGSVYLSVTRDAISAIKTVSLTFDTVQEKANDTYVVSGRHTYTDREGKSRTNLITYVLNKADDDYYIKQFGTAPENAK